MVVTHSRPVRRRRHAPRRAGAAAAAAAALASVVGAAAAQPMAADFDGRWVAGDETLVLRIDADLQQRWRRLRVFVGTGDVTALLRLAAPGVLELMPGSTPWAPGEAELVAWDASTWTEVARVPVRVRSAAGFERSEFTPRAELQLKSRAADHRNDGQPSSPRGTYADTVGQGGLAWAGTRGGWRLEAQAGVGGSSHRAEALRFAELQARAPKVDLAEYRLLLARGEHALEVGHLSYGNHPLLINGVASRGLAARTRVAPGIDLSLTALNGKAVVGADDLLGLDETDQRTGALSLGIELLPERAGGLRAELTWLDASNVARSGFDTGEVPDAERSRGLGLRLLGRTAGGRVAGELALARSRFSNPFDPLLAQGGESQAVRTETRSAHLADLQVVLLQQAPLFGREQAVDFSVGLRHERAAPLYRTLGAFVTADQALTRLQLQAAVQGAQLQWQASRRHDNLERIATLLRTRSDEQTLVLNLPLPAWWGTAGQPSWWPILGANWQRMQQRAVNAPRAEDSGIAATHRPDQRNRMQQLNLGWTVGQGTLNYALSRAHQDNRQPGREQADFRSLGHQVSTAWPLSETLRVNASFNRSRTLSIEQGLVTWVTGGSFGLDWQASERWSHAASLSHNLNDDSLDRASARNTGAQLQSSWRFTVPGLDRPLPGQAFVRIARQGDRNRDRVFELSSDMRSWWVDVGVSISFF